MSSDSRGSHALLGALVSGLAIVFGAAEARAQVAYSITGASPSAGVVSNSAVLTRPVGAPPGPPAVAVPAAASGLVGAPGDELDAISYGGPVLGSLYFSVDAASVGAGGGPLSVAGQAVLLQSAGDIFVPLAPFNTMFRPQDSLGQVPAIPPFAIAVPPVDNMDALDLGAILAGPPPAPFTPPPIFSLAAGNVFGLSGADLLGPTPIPPPVVLIPAAGLGLAVMDDIDALHTDAATGDIYFSLAPGSPSLLVASPGCPAPPCSPADIFFLPGGVLPFLLFAPAGGLGLLPGDNVDAIAFDTDSDGDGVPNSTDNCPATPNATQCDSGFDSCGSLCDPDLTGDAIVGAPDLALLSMSFGMAVPPAPPETDLTCDGVVGGPDFVIFRMIFPSYFGMAPGPGLIGVCP